MVKYDINCFWPPCLKRGERSEKIIGEEWGKIFSSIILEEGTEIFMINNKDNGKNNVNEIKKNHLAQVYHLIFIKV